MATQIWSRADAVTALRPRLWSYLSSTAVFDSASDAADSIPYVSRQDLVRLFSTHLALREETAIALEAARRLLVELPATQASTRVDLFGEVRGLVDWRRTQERRVALADPTVFVCAPPERRYDTPLGRLVKLALWCTSQLADLSELPASGAVGMMVHESSDVARRLLLHPKLSKVRRIQPDAIRHTDELVARRPFVRPLVQLVTDFWAGIVEGDALALARLLEKQFLAPVKDSALFELQVGFDLLDGLVAGGYEIEYPAPLLPAGKAPFATLQRENGAATVWWQRPVWVVDSAGQAAALWARTLEENQLSRQPLRPDFILHVQPKDRVVLVEVKLTSAEEGSPQRDGLRDAIAYLADAEPLLAHRPHPHAIVAAWNASGQPMGPGVRIQICDQHSVADTLAKALGAPDDAQA